MKPLGLMATEDGAGIDFRQLRLQRRARVLSEMERQGIDVLVLGRRGNGKYVAGHRSLWRAVLTPFGPMCLVVRETGQVHLMGTTWDDGIPSEIPTANLSGLMWNPRLTVDALANIDGLSRATVIGVDGMSPTTAQLFGVLSPNAELVDGEQLMRSVRAAKLPDEIDCIRVALALAEGAMTEATRALVPGVTEVELKARFAEGNRALWHHAARVRGRVLRDAPRRGRDGDVTAAAPSARSIARWERVISWRARAGCSTAATRARRPAPGRAPDRPSSRVGRTSSLGDRWRAAVDAMIEECRPGALPVRIRDAWIASGEPLPTGPARARCRYRCRTAPRRRLARARHRRRFAAPRRDGARRAGIRVGIGRRRIPRQRRRSI